MHNNLLLYSGHFLGVKFSWSLKILWVCGKFFVVKYSINHTSFTCGVETKSYGTRLPPYEEICDAEVGEELECQRETSNPHDIFPSWQLQSRLMVQTVLKGREDLVSCLFSP